MPLALATRSLRRAVAIIGSQYEASMGTTFPAFRRWNSAKPRAYICAKEALVLDVKLDPRSVANNGSRRTYGKRGDRRRSSLASRSRRTSLWIGSVWFKCFRILGCRWILWCLLYGTFSSET